MKLFPARAAFLAVLTVGLGLVPAGRTPAGAQEPKKSDEPVKQKEKLMVWVEKFFADHDCPLEAEVTINGKSLGKFQSTTQKDVGNLIKPGRNTIVVTTTPQEPATTNNWLTIQVGAVSTNPRTKKTSMGPVLMIVENQREWDLNEDTGKYTHPFGPNPKMRDKKSVSLTYNFNYAGVDRDRKEVKEGDYVLRAESFFGYNPSVVATVMLNGESLGSFHGGQRSMVVTDLIRPGENEIRLATEAVANQLFDNDIGFEIIGPMSYSTAKQKFLGKDVVQFKAAEGYTRNKDTGVMHLKGKPDTFTHERIIRFTPEAK